LGWPGEPGWPLIIMWRLPIINILRFCFWKVLTYYVHTLHTTNIQTNKVRMYIQQHCDAAAASFGRHAQLGPSSFCGGGAPPTPPPKTSNKLAQQQQQQNNNNNNNKRCKIPARSLITTTQRTLCPHFHEAWIQHHGTDNKNYSTYIYLYPELDEQNFCPSICPRRDPKGSES
jgi:hypothetical protein